MNFIRGDSAGTHTILIYWSEADKCFIAEAPDCLLPIRSYREADATEVQEPIKPLQGRGASHGKALSDAVRRLKAWTDLQQVAPLEPLPQVPRGSPIAGARNLFKRRGARLAVWLSALIVGCAVLATSNWRPTLRSPSPSTTVANISSNKTPVVLPPAAPSATVSQRTPKPIEEVPPQLVVGDPKISVEEAAAGAPRALSLSLPWTVLRPHAGQPPLISLSCTLIPSANKSDKFVRRDQTESYEICRVDLSSNQHELTIELPDGIPAGDYRLQMEIAMKNEAPETIMREVRIPGAHTVRSTESHLSRAQRFSPGQSQ